jgi:starch-binding outer membrane protein, SusD/RagB family
MRNYNKYAVIVSVFLLSVFFLSSCKEFLNPDQEINITKDKLYDDWYEYRSIAMGLYGIQAKLVEQLVILGELRGDLMQITENADADMVEIYNFNVSKENKYASPTNFFRLITAANSFITVLKTEHPEVLDPKSPVTNYDKLYGEALCMRAWAYFNAVRIYGKVPFIPESLTNMDEVNNFLNTSGTYIDSVHIIYGVDGYTNDTLKNVPIALDKQYYDQDLVIDYFTNELTKSVKSVGVNHFIDNNDQTWEVTVWNQYAYDALLGIMYLTDGDLAKAAKHFETIVYTNSDNYRYQIDASFGNNNWRNIYTNIDLREHIFTLWFGKTYFQQNSFQEFFEPRAPHKYMLKPTRAAIMNWETTWDDFTLNVNNAQPSRTRTVNIGRPGDLFRGYGASYMYLQNGMPVSPMMVQKRARELAYEGERFYDLMRVAKRRNDPSFLAKKVSEKFPEERREAMYNLLLNEKNWYINYFE